MKDLFLGIDIGTSSTKVIALDASLTPHAEANQPYAMLSPAPGYAEQDPQTVIDAIFQCLESINKQCSSIGRIMGAGLSCAMHGIFLIDDHGTPLSPLITWADQRSEAEAAALKDTPSGRDIYAQTGVPIHPMTPLVKLIWLQKHKPALMQQAARIVSIKEYLVYLLTGEFLIDHSIASATGLFDLQNRTWYEPALAKAGITKNQLSTPISTTTLLKPKSQNHSAFDTRHSAFNFLIGASDGCLANLGVHANNPSRAALTIGTSGAIRVITDKPVVDEKRRLFTYILDDERYVVGGSINNGGISLQWFHNNMTQAGSIAEHLEATRDIPAGSEGLICLPYLRGERAPRWNSNDRGVYFGVQAQHTAAHFLKAMLEGIAMTLYLIGYAIEDVCGAFQQILANGGVLKSNEWLQIIADVFGKDVVVTPAQDASAVGAVLLTMQALGTEVAHQDFDKPADVIQPSPDAHARYMRLLPLFSELYQKLQADFQRLETT